MHTTRACPLALAVIAAAVFAASPAYAQLGRAMEQATGVAAGQTPEQQRAAEPARRAEEVSKIMTESTVAKAQAVLGRAQAFLRSQQKEDGGWASDREPPAITALVVRGFARDPNFGIKTDFVSRGYDRLLTFQLADGGIYRDLLANYNTAIAISALAAADEPKFKPQIDKAVAYLRSIQWSDQTGPGPKGETVTGKDHPWYGGWGYGNNSRPDGSNLNLAMDALHDAGLSPDDPAYQRALVFITRMQNNSETNDQPWASNDGGFAYTPARNGESMAGDYTTPEGDRRLRSYGSMTYAGLKSMIYAGLTREDPRVKAAWAWITRHWTLDENPGMSAMGPEQAKSGLYYYYMTLARALHAYDQPVIVTDTGSSHDWRVELIDKLATLQNEDGSFKGESRWMEANPILVTAYIVDALQQTLADLKEHPVKPVE